MKLIPSLYVIRKSKRFKNCWDVLKRGKRTDRLIQISSNFTDREDAERLIVELAAGKITERVARKESAVANSE